MLDIYAQKNYKGFLKARIAELKPKRKGLSLRRLAKLIPIQYTYLSKALGDQDTHLSEDGLFTLCRHLELAPVETEVILLQRGIETSDSHSRRQYLIAKLETMRESRQLNTKLEKTTTSDIDNDYHYLFDPLAMVVHMALNIKQYRENPLLLTDRFGISRKKLLEILKILHKKNFIELADNGQDVEAVRDARIHFAKEHPLIRVHQSVLKNTITSQLSRTTEEDKHSFIATFNMDDSGFDSVKNEFRKFLKKVEEISIKSPDKGVYQLNFDLLKWI